MRFSNYRVADVFMVIEQSFLRAIVILPIALYQVLFRAVDVDNDPFDREGSNFFQARTISMGVFIAALVFFALPMVMWKSIVSDYFCLKTRDFSQLMTCYSVQGKRRMNAMLRRWAQADRAVKGPAGYIPVWTVSGPTVFKSRTVRFSISSSTFTLLPSRD